MSELSPYQLWKILEESLWLSLSYFSDPQKRLFALYLLTSLILAWWVHSRSSTRQTFLRYIFAKRIWFSHSARTDYLVFFFNGLVKIVCIAPFLIFGLEFAFEVNERLKLLLGPSHFVLSQTQILVGYTVILFIISDVASYFVHRSMHQVSFLWSFHKTHHSATTLNPVTQYRVHPVELCINNLRAIIVFGIVTGCFRYIGEGQVQKMTFLGVNVLSFLFLAFGSNLRHSHVRLRYWAPLERILISPYQHQIHHSQNLQHQQSNFGAKLAVWDWLFGTLTLSDQVSRITFGLGLEGRNFQSFRGSLFTPFKEILRKPE